MTYALTLMCNPKDAVLTAEHEAWAKSRIQTAGGQVTDVTWLDDHVACDILFDGTELDRAELEDALDNTFPDAPIDIALQVAATRRKKLLLADMDSTMIEQECLDELADFAGLKDKIAGITERAMAGELSFEPALRERVGLLKGLSESALQATYDERITFTPGGRELIMTMRANGGHTCLVSGGFTFFTNRVAGVLGFDENHGNILLAEGGKLTGRVRDPILGKEAKLDTLLRLMKDNCLAQADTMAVGDGANDAEMIEAAGMGIAFHPHKILADAADVRIRHGDLTALLYMQGICRKDFVTE